MLALLGLLEVEKRMSEVGEGKTQHGKQNLYLTETLDSKHEVPIATSPSGVTV